MLDVADPRQSWNTLFDSKATNPAWVLPAAARKGPKQIRPSLASTLRASRPANPYRKRALVSTSRESTEAAKVPDSGINGAVSLWLSGCPSKERRRAGAPGVASERRGADDKSQCNSVGVKRLRKKAPCIWTCATVHGSIDRSALSVLSWLD